jgi:DNA-directed RNA polymerase specialized sigma24 family protein
MDMNDASKTDQQLLREFIERHSDTAFAEIVRRHFDWIHSVARRQAGAEAADDLTQAVFLVLLQKAHVAERRPILSAWLFGVLRFAILRWRRDRQRQRKHEQIAREIKAVNSTPDCSDMLPMLDEF